MEKSTSTVDSHMTALPEDKSLIDTFWKAYKEDFRAFKLYNTATKNNLVENFKRLNPKSKINLQTIIDGVIADANMDNENKFDIDIDRAIQWSQENKDIRNLIMKIGYTNNMTLNKPFLLDFYSQLCFEGRNITQMTPFPFTNLKDLNLSNNYITQLVRGLPHSLEQLVLYNNSINTIDPSIFLPNLQYLNLGFNKLTNSNLGEQSKLAIGNSFPVLLSLDLSFNNIEDLSEVTNSLKAVVSLRMLGIEGNPLCLLRNWKSILIDELQQIKVLDLEDLKVDEDDEIDPKKDTFQALMGNMWGEKWIEEAAEQREDELKGNAGGKGAKKKPDPKKDAAKGKAKAGDDKKAKANEDKAGAKDKQQKNDKKDTKVNKNGNLVNQDIDENNSSRISGINMVSNSQMFQTKGNKDFAKYISFKFEIKTLENIQPVFLEDLETEENKDQLDMLQQCYWFTYQFMGQECSSESKKLYHKDCMSLPSKDPASTDEFFVLDFNNQTDLEFKINKDMQLELYKNVVIKLYTKYPKIKKVKEGEQQLQDEPQIKQVQQLLGFCCIKLDEFLSNSELKQINKKFKVFEYDNEDIFKNSELYWPLPDESTILKANKDTIETLRTTKYAPKKEEEQLVDVNIKGGKPGKPAVKKPPAKKKPVKPVKKGGKGVEDDSVKINLLDWANDARDTISYKNDFLGREDIRKNKNNKFLVSGVKKLAVRISIN